MSSTQPPSPPNDSEEVSDYVIKDKVYYLLYGACLSQMSLSSTLSLTSRIVGKWRTGVVRDHEGSSEDSPRYLVWTHAEVPFVDRRLTNNARATGPRRDQSADL